MARKSIVCVRGVMRKRIANAKMEKATIIAFVIINSILLIVVPLLPLELPPPKSALHAPRTQSSPLPILQEWLHDPQFVGSAIVLVQ